MTDSVVFDPGLGKLAIDLYSEAYITDNDLSVMPQYQRKVRYYNFAYKKLLKILMNNLAFYKGCLAWGYYIVNNCKDAKLTGNPFATMTEEQKAQYAPTEMVDFCIEYVEKFKADLKYYHIKGVELPVETDSILKNYRDFISMNEGFADIKNVSEIKLPSELTFTKSLDEIKSEIDFAIEKQNLDNLLLL